MNVLKIFTKKILFFIFFQRDSGLSRKTGLSSKSGLNRKMMAPFGNSLCSGSTERTKFAFSSRSASEGIPLFPLSGRFLERTRDAGSQSGPAPLSSRRAAPSIYGGRHPQSLAPSIGKQYRY